ncbi:MAG: UDP-N-acetylmuramoyl-tripeptide--D-alanyl-D-alanine ligase [Bacteroidota bacterium]
MTNSAQFTFEELQHIFKTAQFEGFKGNEIITGISTDTRTLQKGNLFIALKGENFDGHSKINDAISRGAVAILGQTDGFKEFSADLSTNPHGFPQIIVENSLKSLGLLGSFHRKRFTFPVVAIAGAAGKTSTKDITAHVLSQKFNVLKTQANYNNQIGVPLTLLQLTDTHTAAVIEIGTNEPGEIEILSNILDATHGLITNIGKEHLEKLIDLDGVEREETALFQNLNSRGAISFVNYDDPRLKNYAKHSLKTVTFGIDRLSDVHAEISLNEFTQPEMAIVLKKRTIHAQLQTLGYFSGLNALCAAAIASELGLSNEEIIKGLESYAPDAHSEYGRMRLEKHGELVIINDTYNANPESMNAALQTLKSFKNNGRKIAVLGDMRELGNSAADEHLDVLKNAFKNADYVYLAGDEFLKAFKNFESNGAVNVRAFENKEELLAELLKVAEPNDAILVKGSRGMKMEEIITELKDQSVLKS